MPSSEEDNLSTDALKKLESAEKNIVNILHIFEETVDELKRIGEVDEQRLEELSKEYIGRVLTLQTTIKEYAFIKEISMEKEDKKKSTTSK